MGRLWLGRLASHQRALRAALGSMLQWEPKHQRSGLGDVRGQVRSSRSRAWHTVLVSVPSPSPEPSSAGGNQRVSSSLLPDVAVLSGAPAASVCPLGGEEPHFPASSSLTRALALGLSEMGLSWRVGHLGVGCDGCRLSGSSKLWLTARLGEERQSPQTKPEPSGCPHPMRRPGQRPKYGSPGALSERTSASTCCFLEDSLDTMTSGLRRGPLSSRQPPTPGICESGQWPHAHLPSPVPRCPWPFLDIGPAMTPAPTMSPQLVKPRESIEAAVGHPDWTREELGPGTGYMRGGRGENPGSNRGPSGAGREERRTCPCALAGTAVCPPSPEARQTGGGRRAGL